MLNLMELTNVVWFAVVMSLMGSNNRTTVSANFIKPNRTPSTLLTTIGQ